MAQQAEGIRILVVDDETPARQRIIDLLEKDAHVGSVLEAANGKDAVEIIEREALDLVFLDVQMPELDGLGVIERGWRGGNAAHNLRHRIRSTHHSCLRGQRARLSAQTLQRRTARSCASAAPRPATTSAA